MASPHIPRARVAFIRCRYRGLIAIAAALAVTPFAAADTWDGGTNTGGAWSTNANWADDSQPTSADTAVFPTPIPFGDATISLSAGEQCQSLTFNDSYALGGGNLQLFAAGGPVSVASGKTATISSSLVGTVGLSKTGSGTLVLSPTGNNTFTGDVGIVGTLSITKDSSLGDSANTVVIGPGAATGAVLTNTVSLTTSRTISPGIFGGAIRAGAGTQFTINGALGGVSNPITFDGAGTVVLGAASTRNGSTTIQNGTVRLNNGSAFGTIGCTVSTNGTLEIVPGVPNNPFTILNNTATLRTTGIGAVHNGGVSVGSAALVTINAGDLATHTMTIGDIDGGSGGGVAAMNGLGSVILSGAGNTFAGQWVVASGTLQLQHADSITASSSPVTIGNSGTVIAGVNSNYAGQWTVSGLLRATSAGGTGTAASIANVGTGGTLQIEGVNLAGAATLDNGGTIKGLGAAGVGGTITAANSVPLMTLATGATATDTLTVSSYSGGTGSLTRVTGSGEVVLSAANPYAGTWDVTAGTLRVEHPNSLGTSPAPVVVNNGGTLHVRSGTFAQPVTLNIGSKLRGSRTSGNVDAVITGTMTVVPGGTATLSSINGLATFGDSPNDLTGGGAGAAIFIDPTGNPLELGAASDFSGSWTIGSIPGNYGWLRITNDNQLGNPSNNVTLSGGLLHAIGTIATSRGLTLNTGSLTSRVNAGGTFTLNSGLSGNGPVIFEVGTTVLNAAATWTGTSAGVQNFGTVVMNHAGALGAASTIALDRGTLQVGDGISVSRPMTMTGDASRVLGGLNSTYSGAIAAAASQTNIGFATGNDPAHVLNVTGVYSGGASSTTRINGSGMVVLSGANTYTGSYLVESGTLKLNSLGAIGSATSPVIIQPGATVIAAVQSSYTGNWQLNGGLLRVQHSSGLGTGTSTVNVDAGDVLQIEGVSLSRNILLGGAGTLAGTGNASYTNSGFPMVANNAGTVLMKAVGASDRLTIGSAIRSQVAASSTTQILVNGAGRVVLSSGGTSATDIFGGSWFVDGGILQVGDVISNSINGLGFKNGDAKQANSVTVNNGTLAIGVNGGGANTPPWLRANVTLSGGAIATTGAITGQLGGDFIVSPGSTSRVLLFDPVSPINPRSLLLAAGAAGVDNNAATTDWGANSTLIVDPGAALAGQGVFTIGRLGGTVNVGANATLQINAGATVFVDSAINPFAAGGNRVNVVNDSTLNGLSVSNTVDMGALTGAGKTRVNVGADVTVTRARQSVLDVGGRLTVRAGGAGGAGTSVANTLLVGGAGKLDLKDNKLIVTGQSLDSVELLIAHGHNGGTWNGVDGIVTSLPAALTGLTSLGVATAGQTNHAGGTFGGVSVSAGDVLVMYTYAGDANLDGFISGDDYAAIDFSIAVAGAHGWVNGDFNHDGIISGDDYTVIDFNIVAQGAPFPTTGAAAALAGATAVPEPHGIGLIAVGTFTLTMRRRRRSSPA